MTDQDSTSSDRTRKLADILNESAILTWSSADLQAILEHQLNSPFREDLRTLSSEWMRRFDAIIDRPGLTIAQVLAEHQPNAALLTLIKDFAKTAILPETVALPEEVGGILYYAAISCAWLRCGAKIHSLNDAALRAGLSWACEQPWTIPQINQLFRDHLDQLDAG